MQRFATPILMLLLSVTMSLQAQKNTDYYLVTGTYDSDKSEGIYVYHFDGKTGKANNISHVKSSNTSFLTVSADEKYVFATNENGNQDNGGEVSSFSFDKKTGTLTAINKQLSAGDHPCYIDVDKTGKWVITGNYSSGTLAVLPVAAGGKLQPASAVIKHSGSGVDKSRQEKPHVHCTQLSADNKWLFVPDLGIDKVMIYAFDNKTGKLTAAPQPFAKIKDGGGPRHITFHPSNKYAYLIEEMGGAVAAFAYSNGTLKELQQIPSVETGDTGFIGSADIHVSPDGKFLYASNRGGNNSIAIYSINQADGTLTLAGHQSSGGKIPRNFTIHPSGDFLLAGNQESDNIVIFKRDKATGLLTDTGNRINVGKPVCLKWIKR